MTEDEQVKDAETRLAGNRPARAECPQCGRDVKIIWDKNTPEGWYDEHEAGGNGSGMMCEYGYSMVLLNE